MKSYPTYVMEIYEINLWSRKVLPGNQPPYPPEYLEEEKEDSATQVNAPPYAKRLIHPRQHTPEEAGIIGELKKLCVNIPLLQAIKDVPIYKNIIKEECFKRPRRRRKYTSTINVVGQLSDLMLGRVISPKYLECSSPVVDVHIDGIMVPNTLIELGAGINVMNRESMLNMNLQGALRKTNTMLQLAEISIVDPKGVIEDVLVSIVLSEYATNFLVLHPKTKFNFYPLILGIYWLDGV